MRRRKLSTYAIYPPRSAQACMRRQHDTNMSRMKELRILNFGLCFCLNGCKFKVFLSYRKNFNENFFTKIIHLFVSLFFDDTQLKDATC